ncbi:MAG: hypothetical protein FJZ56_01555 [Chlamydiae bacterium]|nr:hypothetical protein [Chlamydiota bacterium]
MINPILQSFRENLAQIEPNRDNKEKLSDICQRINELIKDNPQLLKNLDARDLQKLNQAISKIGKMQLEKNVVVEIAKTSAAWNGRIASQNIQKYGITDQIALIEIVKIIADQDVREVSENIQNYGIIDQRTRIEIAKIIAAQDGSGVSRYIQNYGITDKKALIEIAQIAVRDACGASEYIQNYGITDKKALIEMAKILAARYPRGLSEYIQNYGITDQNALIEIAKIAAALDGRGLSQYIQNYGIRDQNALIEIVKIVAAREGGEVSEYIQNYRITDEDALVEIAKIAAAQDGRGLSRYIQNYGITDEDALVEIAKIAARYGKGISEYIDNYGITDQRALIEIAKIAAAQNGWATSIYIKNYGISNQFALIEIAKIAAKDPVYYMEVTKDFGPIPEEDRFTIAAFVVQRRPVQVISWLEKNPFNSSDLQRRLDCCIRLLSKIDQDKHDVEEDIPEELQPIKGILEAALKYRNSSLAKDLISEAISQTVKPGYTEALLKIAGEERHKQLVSVVPAKWMIEEGEPVALGTWINTKRAEFRNRSSPLQQQYLLTVMSLDRAKEISPRRKLELLEAVMSQNDTEQVLSGLRLMQSICVVHKAEELNTLNIEELVPEMTRVFGISLLEDRFRGLSNIENVAQKYIETFGNMRIPYAFDTYLAALRALPEMQEPVERFGTSVLSGTFNEERMRIDNNPHLQKIAEYDERQGTDILTSWNTLSPEVYVKTSEKSEKSEISYRDFFITKSQSQHWHKDGVDQFPELTAYLATGEKLQNLDPKKQRVIDACIDLIENPQDPVKKLEKISSYLGAFKVELQNDIKGLIKTLNAPTSSTALQEKVEICRGWEDLFLCGTEVEGSCQRIDGDVDLNKCLLAYCLDGKTSMIAIKNKEGKIVARAILKLLWDDQTGKPVLFLEQCYPEACSNSRKEGIKEMAIAFAKKLNCSLYTKGNTEVSSLTSFGSSCPYEYEDEEGGVQQEGKFTITKAAKIVIE